MTETSGNMYKESANWARLAICANVHIKQALLGILHNQIEDQSVNGIPSDQEDLYQFLQAKKNKIEKEGIIKGEKELRLLFPTVSKRVDSSKFDITMLRYLVRTFCKIKNAKGKYDQPDSNDTTLFAYVYRAAELRNEINHFGDIKAMKDEEFENLWEKMIDILRGLRYEVDIEPERTNEIEISRLQGDMVQEWDLDSLIKLFENHPNKNVGKITQTKLIISTILNRLTTHVKLKNDFTFKTFHDMCRFLEGIRSLGAISFDALLEGKVALQVEVEEKHFKYDEIKVERDIFDGLDLFYVRNFEGNFELTSHDLIIMDFLSACHLFAYSDKWNSILKLNEDRQLVIISFIAGLHADDLFVKDFVENVLNPSRYSLDQFLGWLYNVDVRKSLPDGGYDYKCWFGLMETLKLSPSFFLLDFISHEVEIPQTFVPKTIICYCDYSSPFEWYDMNYFHHRCLTKLTNNFNIESFLRKFSSFNFIVKGNINIRSNVEFDRLNQCAASNAITFKINELNIETPLSSCFTFSFDLNTFYKRDTFDMILSALSTPTSKISSSTSQPVIKCKRLGIKDIELYNPTQTAQVEKLFELGLSGVFDSILLDGCYEHDFYELRDILESVAQRTKNTPMHIELCGEDFHDVVRYMLRRLDPFLIRSFSTIGISLNKVRDVDNLGIECFSDYTQLYPSKYSYILYKYKIIEYDVPFVRKENYLCDGENSFFLNLCDVDFKNVSSNAFAKAFSSIPTLSCRDDDDYIPSGHWLSLSKIKPCKLNELRIWYPKSQNYAHFLSIKTNSIQFICKSKDKLKKLLTHIVNKSDVQLDKELKVFLVEYDKYDWNYYKEIKIFVGETIEKYKDNYSSYDKQLDDKCVPFYEGELYLYWCCEITLPGNNQSMS